jgi:hypothetical protein
MRDHSRGNAPIEIWDHAITIQGTSVRAVIRSMEVDPSVLPCRKLWQPRPRQPWVAWERVPASRSVELSFSVAMDHRQDASSDAWSHGGFKGRAMSRSDHAQEHSLNCMRLAADCARLAADTNRPVWQQHFLRMAKEWRSLAEMDPGAQDLS